IHEREPRPRRRTRKQRPTWRFLPRDRSAAAEPLERLPRGLEGRGERREPARDVGSLAALEPLEEGAALLRGGARAHDRHETDERVELPRALVENAPRERALDRLELSGHRRRHAPEVTRE